MQEKNIGVYDMYRVIIADDDFLFRKNLRSTIDWKAYDMCISGEASNGQEALDLINEVKPDIVVCDIKMPILDGMDVLKRLKNTRLLKFIILSGYDSFEFAKQAIKYGAFDYALKPLNAEELSGILLRALESLNKDKNRYKENIKHNIEIRRLIVEEYESLIIHLIESRDISSICEYIDSYYCEMHIEVKIDNLDNSFTEFMVIADKACRMFKINTAVIFEKFQISSSFSRNESNETEAETIKNVFKEIVSQIITTKNSECKKIVYEVIDYIEENYVEKISLESIAKRYFINPSYFSQIFKSNVNENFSCYLINTRIKKAQELLLLEKFKVYQISEMVGYDNEKYFFQIFKKYTGLTPMEYVKVAKRKS
ncbi:MAG: response regulator [Clostridiales bacterium]|nr:response regulator [Clostridiales bacterium]